MVSKNTGIVCMHDDHVVAQVSTDQSITLTTISFGQRPDVSGAVTFTRTLLMLSCDHEGELNLFTNESGAGVVPRGDDAKNGYSPKAVSSHFFPDSRFWTDELSLPPPKTGRRLCLFPPSLSLFW